MNDGTYAFKVDIDLNQKNTLTKKELYNIIKSLGPQIITLDGNTINIRNQGAREYNLNSSFFGKNFYDIRAIAKSDT